MRCLTPGGPAPLHAAIGRPAHRRARHFRQAAQQYLRQFAVEPLTQAARLVLPGGGKVLVLADGVPQLLTAFAAFEIPGDMCVEVKTG